MKCTGPDEDSYVTVSVGVNVKGSNVFDKFQLSEERRRDISLLNPLKMIKD